MERERNLFPHDYDNRIQKLYYDIDINTIFNRTKLQNIKNKFIKYVNYLIQYEKKFIQPEVLRLEKICIELKIKDITESSKFRDDPTTPESITKFVKFSRTREAECIECSKQISLQKNFNKKIDNIYIRINQIKTHQFKIYKHYKKCENCEKMDMVIISGCKSKHKLCYNCIDYKTECPVCNEDLGLQHCDICLEYKKELVDTGCKNKHQTCKDCLDKIQKNKKRRELDHNIRNGYHRDTEPYYFK